jgi:hypothetical protein
MCTHCLGQILPLTITYLLLRRKWRNINTEEGRRNYRKLRNELKRTTDMPKRNNTYKEITEYHRAVRYYLMYMKTKV